jgi:Arc/MetJ-type ribon-helix-helix transcriptional regulator
MNEQGEGRIGKQRNRAMTIELKPEHQRVIDRAIQSGAYYYPDEVISAALEMLAEGIQDGNGQPRKSRLWELREGLSLGDISIRELIEEGRA